MSLAGAQANLVPHGPKHFEALAHPAAFRRLFVAWQRLGMLAAKNRLAVMLACLFVCLLVWLFACLFGWLAGWLVGWWLVGCLVV